MKIIKKQVFFLWLACILGGLLTIPYIASLGVIKEGNLLLTASFITIQTALIYGLCCWGGYRVLPFTSLQPFKTDNWIKPGIFYGFLVGVLLVLLEKLWFSHFVFIGPSPPWWAGLLASFYGAVNEEVICRFFLFTSIFALISKAVSSEKISLWIANVLVAALFGIGHLPALYAISNPDFYAVLRVLLLNFIPGLTFGWLYWERGLWCAMVAHFVTDLIVHVLVPLAV